MSKLKGAMAGIAAGAAGVAGIAYAAKRMLDYADAIGKAADRIGVATESLQEFRYAANLSGVETSKLDKGLEAFTKRLGEARQDTGALTTYLSKYNEELLKSVKNADSTEDALKMIADEMGNMESASDKAALGAAAFSRSAGVEMVNMLKKGSDGLEEMQKEARNTGAVLEDRFVRQAERTNDQLTLMSQVLKTNLARAIISMTPTILRISKAFQSWAGSLRSVLDSIVPMQLMSLEGLRDEIAETEKRIENYEKKMRQGGKLTGAWGSKLSEARKYLEDLRTEEKATEQQLKAFEEALQAGTKATGNNTEANEENAKSLDYVLTSLKVLTQAEKDRIAQLKQDQSTWEDFYKQDYLKSVMDSQEYEIMLAEEKADKMRKIAKELGKDELAVERWLREEKARIQESTADKMVEEQEQAAGETTKIYEPMINDCISCAA
jgi:nucleoside-triphosphatase THEP1